LVPVAVGSTKAEDWDVGTMSTRMGVAHRRLPALGITADAVPFQLGETDGLQGTTTAAWADSMNSAIAKSRAEGIEAPWVVVKCTCVNGANATTRAGVDAIVNGIHVRYGPDFGTLNNSYRFDSIHCNDLGQATAAAMWRDVLSGFI
jgi:hypothetical protein